MEDPQTLFFQLACSCFGQERRLFWDLTLEFIVHTCVHTCSEVSEEVATVPLGQVTRVV